MKRQTILLALLVVILALRPAPPSAETALGRQGMPPAEPGKIVGTVTRAGTADPLGEVLIVAQRGAAAAPIAAGARAAGPSGGRFSRRAIADVSRWNPIRQENAVPRIDGNLWQWIGLPVVAAGGGARGLQAQRGAAAQLRTVTDEAGRFTIENVPPGQYFVTAQLEGYFAPAVAGFNPGAAMRVNATVTAGTATEVNFPLIPGGAISGRVVDPRGRAVVDSTVQALRLMYQPDGSAALQGAGNRPTDDRGEYRLYRLPPGEYYLVANPRTTAAVIAVDGGARETQMRTFYPAAVTPALGTPIVIRGGEEFAGANIQIRNIPLAKISGRVINAMPLSAFDPPQPAQRGQAAQPALAAAADPNLQPLVDEVAKAQAAVQEARGRLQEARGLRGAAPAQQQAPQPAQRALPVIQLQLFPRDRNALVDPNSGNRSATAPLALPNDGRFEIPNVPPGSYDLYASLPDNAGYGPQQPPGPTTSGRSFGRVSIEVSDADVSDVSVTIHQGADVRGRVIVDGRPVNFTGAHIVLQPDDSSTKVPIYQQVGRSEAQVAADGSFIIPAVPEAAYRVQVTLGGPGPAPRGGRGATAGLDAATTQEILAQAQAGGNVQTLLAEARGRIQAAQNAATPTNPNAYVADVRQNGVTIYDTGLVIGSGPVNSLDIYVETNAGSIAGTVIGADQKPVAGATVVLVPSPARRRNPDLYRTATTGEDGKFTMIALPPGDFKLFAWQTLAGAQYLNPSFIAPYEERGAAVSIFAGGQLSAEVALIKEAQ